MDRRRHVLPVVAQRRRDLLGGGEHDRGLVADQVERGAEGVDRQQLGDVRPFLGLLVGCDLGQLAVLERELGCGVELDSLGLAERALGEGRKPADRLDLVAEQLEPRGAVLGRRKDVEDAAADRELAPLLDLVGVLVAGLDQQLGDVGEVDLLAAVKREALRAQLGVRHRLGERHGARDDHGRRVAVGALGGERVEGPDSQADQVRRRREVGLIAGPARRVVAHPARRQVGAERPGQVARADVVGGDHQRRASGERSARIEQRGEQIGADRGGCAQVDRLAGPDPGREGGDALVVERYVEQRSEQSADASGAGPGPREARDRLARWQRGERARMWRRRCSASSRGSDPARHRPRLRGQRGLRLRRVRRSRHLGAQERCRPSRDRRPDHRRRRPQRAAGPGRLSPGHRERRRRPDLAPASSRPRSGAASTTSTGRSSTATRTRSR